MITNFNYWLGESDKWNPVVYITYTSQNLNDKKFFGIQAMKIVKSLWKSKQISDSLEKLILDKNSDIFNLRSLKKATDEAFKNRNIPSL